MKIAIVCFNLSWQSGGPRLIFSAAQALQRAGHTVRIYAPEFSGKYFKELWTGLDIQTVPEAAKELLPAERPTNLVSWILGKIKREQAQVQAAKKIAKAIAPDFDVVNVHDFAYPVGYFYRNRNANAKIIWTENDPPYSYLPKKGIVKDFLSRAYNNWKDVAAQRYFEAIDSVSVLDEYNAAWCKRRGLKPIIIRLGVDFKNFYLPVKDFTQRAKEKKAVLFGLGSLNSYRHYEDMLRAVAILRGEGYSARARIIANDMWNESAYRQKLLKIIENEKIGDAVDISFSGVSEEGLKAAYRESDFFVYPMYVPPPRDGFGFSIGVFEAMAAGLPVILCRTTASTEVLKDGESAFFVDPESPGQIAEKIKFAIANPDRCREIAEQGQKIVQNDLTWEQYVSGLLSLIGKER